MIYREQLDDVGRMLVLSVRSGRTPEEEVELAALYRSLGGARSREAARINGSEAMVGNALRSVLPEQEFDLEWRDWLESNERRVADLLDATCRVMARFEEAACPTALVESAGVLVASSQALAAMGSHDADILALPADQERLDLCVRAEGFERRSRRDHRSPMDEYARLEPDGHTTWCNLYYRPFERVWTPLPYRDRNPIWLTRRVRSRKNPGLFVLDPADALAHVSMHTAFHGFVRKPGLRLHADVDGLVRDNVIDWERYVGEIRAMGIATRAFVSLSIAAGLLGTPVPDSVLAALYPGRPRWSALSALLRSVSVISDGRPTFGKLSTVMLELLLDDRGPIPWLASTLVPPAEWMRERATESERDQRTPLLRLHINRYWRAMTGWKPQ